MGDAVSGLPAGRRIYEAMIGAPLTREPPRRAKRRNPEFELQAALGQHLRLRAAPNIYWTAIPMGMSGATWRRKIARLGGRPGAPDMLLLIGGRAHGLELKSEGGRLSPSQKQTMREWRAAGGVYEVAKGLDEALAILTEWGALRPC